MNKRYANRATGKAAQRKVQAYLRFMQQTAEQPKDGRKAETWKPSQAIVAQRSIT